jgi:UrcA family protein
MTKTALLTFGLICASSAFAQPREAAPPLQSEQIAYGDLNLNSSNGQAVLRHRIQAAAGRVCDTGGMQSMEDFHLTAQCYRLSYKDGVHQMDRIVAASRTGTYLAASAIVISAK